MNIQQFLEEEAKKHLAHVGGDERTIPALVMLLKDVSNKVLSEVKREVEKEKDCMCNVGIPRVQKPSKDFFCPRHSKYIELEELAEIIHLTALHSQLQFWTKSSDYHNGLIKNIREKGYEI